MNKRLFDKYISNTASSSEIDSFFEWVLKKSQSKDSILLFQNYWKKGNTEKQITDKDKNVQLDKIHHQLNLRNKNTPLKSKRGILISFLSKAAAIILIPILTLFVYTQYFETNNTTIVPHKIVMNEVISPIGSRITLELSDGTKVWLNHGSKLIYPQQFSKEKRVVKLVGEGYFDVFHNPEKPFIVETSNAQVVALGTQFNVNAYPNERVISATLKSGKIVFKADNKPEIEVKPGQKLRWNKQNKTAKLKDVDADKYIAWKDGKLVFEDDSFKYIANRLSRWYNVDIEFDSPKINELTYTATFIDEPLYQILEMMEIVSPIKCTSLKRTKLEDGTYSKKKIKVTLKNKS